eukprot:TRINITY_DN3516_c0_g1_i5.p2 TRINITY_DN3516_c0_g1~~TRINITY_DN3516_c0_g1_i5.p2  ORF type:complete len:100 (+),score=22.02 TRINITY_DN3516_c0_g1_i5:872-1171(+)
MFDATLRMNAVDADVVVGVGRGTYGESKLCDYHVVVHKGAHSTEPTTLDLSIACGDGLATTLTGTTVGPSQGTRMNEMLLGIMSTALAVRLLMQRTADE